MIVVFTNASNKCLSVSNLAAVQIFHVPERQHWIATSYLNGELQVYDSKCGSKFTPSVESQIASIFSPISHDNALVNPF